MRLTLLLCSSSVFICIVVESLKVIVTNIGISGSQNLIMYRTADLIAARGHDVTVIQGDILEWTKKPPLRFAKEWRYNVTHDSVTRPKPFMSEADEFLFLFEEVLRMMEMMNRFPSSDSGSSAIKILLTMKRTFDTLASDCATLLRDDTSNIVSRVRQLKADVAVVHMIDMCWMGIVEHLGIRHRIWMSTGFLIDPIAWYSQTPTPTSYVASCRNANFDHNLFHHRIKNSVITPVVNALFYWTFIRPYLTVHLHYNPNSQNLVQVLRRVKFIFVTADVAIELPRPLTPKIAMIGGHTMMNAENLTKEWLDIIDGSGEHGVVIFAFGTVVNTAYMPESLKMKFLDAFKRLQQRVIWRLDGEFKPAEKVPNIFVKKWIPQKELLAHPKVKAFISHGGYNSFTEATYAGVPIVVIPLIGDQFRNARRVTDMGIGISIDIESASGEEIFTAIHSVVNNRTIQTRAKKLKAYIRDRLVTQIDTALYAVSKTVVFSQMKHSQLYSSALNFVPYFQLDVIATFALFHSVLLYLCI